MRAQCNHLTTQCAQENLVVRWTAHLNISWCSCAMNGRIYWAGYPRHNQPQLPTLSWLASELSRRRNASGIGYGAGPHAAEDYH
jgi:hypothetical protein